MIPSSTRRRGVLLPNESPALLLLRLVMASFLDAKKAQLQDALEGKIVSALQQLHPQQRADARALPRTIKARTESQILRRRSYGQQG